MTEITDEVLAAIRENITLCTPIIQSLVVRIDRVERERDIYAVGLNDVVNPLGYLLKEADKEGNTLNSFAVVVCNDVGFIKQIAKNALEDAEQAVLQDIRRTCGNSD